MSLLTPRAQEIDLDAALVAFDADGFAPLGRILTDAALCTLREAAEDLVLGRFRDEAMFFQLDSPTGKYDDLAFRKGYVGPRHDYRKVEKIEREPRFRALIENALFARICRARIGDAVAIYRAVLWMKVARGGTLLPWHQDGGRFWGLDRDPTLQIWTALDDAPLDGGCLEVVPGTHRAGLVTPFGGQVAEAAQEQQHAASRAMALPARAGEAFLLHNHLWHRSGLNHTASPRRAVSISFMDAATRCVRKKHAPRTFVRVFEG